MVVGQKDNLAPGPRPRAAPGKTPSTDIPAGYPFPPASSDGLPTG
jgi:hypothetical protein